MSDTHRRYCATKAALRQVIAVVPDTHSEKHLNTLTALICGLVGARHSHLAKLADHAPSQGAKRESRIERFERWLRQPKASQATYFMPFAHAVLAALASQPLVLIMDGSLRPARPGSALGSKGATVIFVGAGEFDGTTLLTRLQDYGWHYVCRTATTTLVWVGTGYVHMGQLLKAVMFVVIDYFVTFQPACATSRARQAGFC
ncbi:MAG: hypothetical protein KIT87_08705 [Anaerolineae bacterium]|nr:hypothetical protein [Anaerolineae bacterium]